MGFREEWYIVISLLNFSLLKLDQNHGSIEETLYLLNNGTLYVKKTQWITIYAISKNA